MSGAVVVLGASGRLGPVVVSRLQAAGWRAIRCSRNRGDVVGLDVLDPAWQQPGRWRAVLAAASCRETDLACVINLVASRHPSPAVSRQVGAASIRCLAALGRLAAAPVTIHVGSVAEYRAGHRSAYALGKIAARDEARSRAVTAILTVGVVPRPPGDPRDRYLRWSASRLPDLADLPIDVSAPAEVGDALASLVNAGWYAGLSAAPAELTLAGNRRALGQIVGLGDGEPRSRWYSPVLRTAMDRLPLPPYFASRRAVSCTRQAAGRFSVHYATAPPESARGLAAEGRWSISGCGCSRMWLIADNEQAGDQE